MRISFLRSLQDFAIPSAFHSEDIGGPGVEGGALPPAIACIRRFSAMISSNERTHTLLGAAVAPVEPLLDAPDAADELPPAELPPPLGCVRLGGAVPRPNQSSAMVCTASGI